MQVLPESCMELKCNKDLTETKGLDLPCLCAMRGSLRGWGRQGNLGGNVEQGPAPGMGTSQLSGPGFSLPQLETSACELVGFS